MNFLLSWSRIPFLLKMNLENFKILQGKKNKKIYLNNLATEQSTWPKRATLEKETVKQSPPHDKNRERPKTMRTRCWEYPEKVGNKTIPRVQTKSLLEAAQKMRHTLLENTGTQRTGWKNREKGNGNDKSAQVPGGSGGARVPEKSSIKDSDRSGWLQHFLGTANTQ